MQLQNWEMKGTEPERRCYHLLALDLSPEARIFYPLV